MNKTSKALIQAFGNRAEIMKAISELSELSAALSEYLYCIETNDLAGSTMAAEEVLEEMGDTRLTLNTLTHIFGRDEFHTALMQSIGKAEAVMRLHNTDKETVSRYAKRKCC